MTSAVPRRRRLALVSLVVGIILVATAVVLFRGNTPAPTNAGVLPTMSSTAMPSTAMPSTSVSPAAAAAPSRSSSSPSTADQSTSDPLDQAAPVSTTHAATSPNVVIPTTSGPHIPAVTSPATPSATAAHGRPAVLHLPTLNVTAAIDPVDSVSGVLQVPDDISRVGWWQHSADAGATAGSTVIDGHIDSAVAGQGALFHLGDLGPGDQVSVTTTSGSTVHYVVQARRVYVKEQGLPADLFDQRGPGRLVLISCGGAFDKSIRSYEDNIVVFATVAT